MSWSEVTKKKTNNAGYLELTWLFLSKKSDGSGKPRLDNLEQMSHEEENGKTFLLKWKGTRLQISINQFENIFLAPWVSVAIT